MKDTQYTGPNPRIYNPDGEYGGNQCSPDIIAASENAESNPEYRELCHIVKSHFPNMTPKEIRDYMYLIRSESCSYVGMINSLFEEFIDRPDEFYQAFGFPMCNGDGSFNYNHILVDLYCKKDNHMGYRFLFWTWDFHNKHEDHEWKDENNDGKSEWVHKPYGNSDEQIKYRWETYCREHGVKVNVTRINSVTPKKYYKIRQYGYLTLSASNYKLIDENGNVSDRERGHTMTITDVTKDQKKYIVSSWGKRYYFDLADAKGYLYYYIIKYKKTRKKK